MTTFAVVGLVVLAVAAALVVVTVATVRRLRRTVFRWRTRLLDLRSHVVPPGPRRDVITLRRRLAAEMRSTQHLLTAAPDARLFQLQAAPILREVLGTAAVLDAELADIERYPDPARQRGALDVVAPQARQVIDLAYRARETVLRSAAADRERGLQALTATVAHEAAALATYRRAKDELTL